MPPNHMTGNPMKGILLVTLAVMVFALADVATKHLTMLYSVTLVIALRYLVNLVLLAVLLAPRHGRALIATNRTGLVALRAVFLAAASLTMGIALRYMPVGETVAIIYLAPFLVMLLSGPLLGEKVPLAGWIGAAAGFFGVLLIVRPGSGLDPVGVAFALVNAGFATGYHILSRILARTESTMAMLFHTALIGVLIFGGMLLFTGTGPLPSGWDIAITLALGALAALGHFLFTAAYREAPASLLAPVNYMHLVWAALLGGLVFGHYPDGLTMTGMALVAGAGVAVALRAHLARRSANREPAATPDPEAR
jgi:drug/metabolite transporter (DMT)-like permease